MSSFKVKDWNEVWTETDRSGVYLITRGDGELSEATDVPLESGGYLVGIGIDDGGTPGRLAYAKDLATRLMGEQGAYVHIRRTEDSPTLVWNVKDLKDLLGEDDE